MSDHDALRRARAEYEAAADAYDKYNYSLPSGLPMVVENFVSAASVRIGKLEAERQAQAERITMLQTAYAHELALKQAYGDGWRTRIALGYIRAWRSVEELNRWNNAANSNPHQWNTDLYNEWRRGFMQNDFHRTFTLLTMNIRPRKHRAPSVQPDADAGERESNG